MEGDLSLDKQPFLMDDSQLFQAYSDEINSMLGSYNDSWKYKQGALMYSVLR